MGIVLCWVPIMLLLTFIGGSNNTKLLASGVSGDCFVFPGELCWNGLVQFTLLPYLQPANDLLVLSPSAAAFPREGQACLLLGQQRGVAAAPLSSNTLHT